jgi:hypothetical protein
MSFDARLTVTVIATICVIAAIAVVLPARIFVERSSPEEDATVLLLSHVAKQRLQEAVAKAGRGPSPAERAKLRHVMMPIANHLATRLDTLNLNDSFGSIVLFWFWNMLRFLYTEVAERARSNPTKPGHQVIYVYILALYCFLSLFNIEICVFYLQGHGRCFGEQEGGEQNWRDGEEQTVQHPQRRVGWRGSHPSEFWRAIVHV